MTTKTRQKIYYAILVISVSALLTFGGGVYREVSASSDDTYRSLKIFSDVIEQLENNYVEEVDSKELIQKAIQGMVQSLDPHSTYLPPDAFELLQDDTKGEFSGVGIVITARKGMLIVVSPIEGTPAYRAGIKAGDIIYKVDGTPTREITIGETVKKIKGPKGTSVTLTILRKGSSKPIDFKIVRNVIPIESVRHIMLNSKYGYVRIYNFTEKTTYDIEGALDELESGETELKGLIMDIRDNPGGLLPQAIGVSELFLEEGTILSIKGRLKKHTQIYKAHKNEKKRDYPIIVLINGGSASASEIVAGALQDHKRALVLGTTSFGKGSVQTVKPLRDGSGLKFTIARYYTPSGQSIQAKGIEPDIILKRKMIEETETEEDWEDIYNIKEKDLKNHLEAEPDKKSEKNFKSGKEEESTSDSSLEHTEFAALNLKTLMLDNQVSRALDILVSYEIFKNLKE
ncbi:MAG: S41 family peptidase [Deltaproteobacteria bacterium]|nr:S41 family peptidase [Deltaproteobacteria bacterium]